MKVFLPPMKPLGLLVTHGTFLPSRDLSIPWQSLYSVELVALLLFCGPFYSPCVPWNFLPSLYYVELFYLPWIPWNFFTLLVSSGTFLLSLYSVELFLLSLYSVELFFTLLVFRGNPCNPWNESDLARVCFDLSDPILLFFAFPNWSYLLVSLKSILCRCYLF